ncbi:hypothetical protein KIH79_04065 [Bifidobacterium sp. 82T10]|uniref:Streptococcal pilin isopeptide linkage domain-containing protein n=1 Tax=Bifidobacterium miconis TaxID=2834435 RepID=A0ABS6WDL4_9BIFI|nr:hypothetical protein [Bifidobacterium miconis]
MNDTKDGITYDHTWQYVQVKVTLDKETGALKTSVTDANTNSDTAAFTNSYDATGAATLGAKKAFKNADGSARPIPENDFQFQLHEGETTNGKVLQTKVAKTDGSVTFDPIAYKLSDLGGMKAKTFTYTVNEVVPADKDKLPGVDYDTTAHTYTVTVTDNDKGKLTTKVAVDGNANEQQPTFTNTYSAEGSAKLSGVKKVTGKDGRDYTAVFAGKFGFTLTGKDGAPIRVSGTGGAGSDAGKLVTKDSLTATNAADGGVSFDGLHYTLADLGGARSRDFTYVVAESSDKTVAGVTNDANATREVTVSVSDDGSGRLSAVVKHEKDQPSFTFTNTYAAGGSLTLTGTKTLTGRKLTDADRFTFTVYEGYQSADKPGTPVSTGTSDKTGRIAFDKPLQYTLKDLGEHTYTVVESEAGLPKGVSAVTKTRTFTVSVADETHDGKLTVTATGLGKGNSVSFENAYTTTDSAPVGFRGVKLLDGAPIADFDGRFTFTLTGEQGAPMPVKAKDGRLSVTNDKTGNVDFGTVTFTKADLAGEAEKTFTYTVTESGSAPGVTNDATATRTFTVTLRDNGDGTLSATASPAEGPLFTFTNTYSAKSTTDSFSFTKTLNGRDLHDGEFTFVLDAKDDAPMPRSATATNNADGRIAFGPITYDKPGTYTYTVREQSGDETGVMYDDATYVVTVTVTDHGDGTLSATHTVADANGKTVSQPTFVNTYTPPATPPDTPQPTPVTVNFDARKTLNGRDLRDGEFTFVLRDADGKTLQSAANTADGTIVFQPITYTEAGTWRYEITETAGDDANMTYDRTTYKVTVTVTDDGNGKLTANVAYSSGFLGLDRKTPEFVNTYTPPATPPDTPEEPGKPEQPETPGTPEQPTTPGQPTQPTQPTDRSYPKTPLSQTGAATSSIMAAFTALLGCGLALGMIRLHGTIARSPRKSKGRHAQ